MKIIAYAFANFWRWIIGLFKESEVPDGALVNRTPTAAEQYGWNKKEDRPYNHTGISFYYGVSKNLNALNKKIRNRNRSKLQARSRKVNFGLA